MTTGVGFSVEANRPARQYAKNNKKDLVLAFMSGSAIGSQRDGQRAKTPPSHLSFQLAFRVHESVSLPG